MKRAIRTASLAAAIWWARADAQAPTPPTQSATQSAAVPIDEISAAQSDGDTPPGRLVKWNEYDGKYFSIRGGGGFLVDYNAFAQDAASKEQISVDSRFIFRDGRALFRGKLKFIKSRDVTWSAGIMYNSGTSGWQFRQTGIMVSVPEIWGDIFVGRTKEGVSLNKVMIGYGGWTMERATMNDAALPILADGVKWLGYAPKLHLVWSAGTYWDLLSKGLAFSTYERQTAGRAAYVRFESPNAGKLFHAGLNLRYGVPTDGSIQMRSRPEAYAAPYFVSTGSFDAKNTKIIGPEMYYRNASFLAGTEYFFEKANAPESGNPWFNGGEVFASWLPTGETRSYNVRGAYFDQITPKRSVFEGGRGAWELVMRYSYIDLNGGTLQGGKFWRVTPMVSWFWSDHVRWEFNYGYGSLNRFQLDGKTQFFQARIQLQL